MYLTAKHPFFTIAHLDLAAVPEIVASQGKNFFMEFAAGSDQFQYLVNLCIIEKLLGYYQVVSFFGDGHKIKLQCLRRRQNAHAGIDAAAGNRCRHAHVGVLLMVVALDVCARYAVPENFVCQ